MHTMHKNYTIYINIVYLNTLKINDRNLHDIITKQWYLLMSISNSVQDN